MRKSTRKAADIEAEMIAEDNRRTSRSQGFSMMDVRDRGYARIQDKNGREAVLLWFVPRDRRRDNLIYENVPEDGFALVIDGQKHVFDGEEMKRCLRWV